jgi:hypothetical protein
VHKRFAVRWRAPQNARIERAGKRAMGGLAETIPHSFEVGRAGKKARYP